jgi:phosphohistidine phosphatase SixA
VSVFLIRHANAGSRSKWQGDDALRPLNGRGRRQAEIIAELLGDRRIARILSSPATRCIQTVEPLAAARGLEIGVDKRLAEGGPLDHALEVVLHHDAQALCAHGDLIPEIMDALVRRGMKATAPGRCQKGSIWEIELRAGEPVEARYHWASASE